MTLTSTTPAIEMTPQEAFELLQEELAAMREEDVLRRPGLDPATATTIVLGSLGRILEHRGDIVTKFGDEGAQTVDVLAVVAKATMQANSNFAASDSASDLSERFATVAKSHALLLADADALVQRGLLERGRVDQGRPSQGYRTTLSSLMVLIAIFREKLPGLAGFTPLTLDQLKLIEKDAVGLIHLLDEREVGATRLPAAQIRARAVSKLIRTYGEVRRMLTYVRWWAEDADQIAPSLWSGRRGRRRNAGAGEDGGPVPPEPMDPMPGVPNNGGGPFTS